jgi:uncharacterized membrane protein
MQKLMTLLGGTSLGAGAMYVMDPERGRRRRAELRATVADVAGHELVERARRLEPVAAVRQLAAGVSGGLAPWRWASAVRPRRRRRVSPLAARDWALLGGLVGAVAVALWLTRRAQDGGQGIDVERAITVQAPVERVYEFWSNPETFPRFMSHVHEVRRTGPDRTHWVVAGPAGAPIAWDAVTTERVLNELIGWRTVEGAVVEHHGTVRFHRLDAGATRIEVRLTVRPLGGALGHRVAALFGGDPERVIGEDLERLVLQLHGERPAVGESGSWR